MASLIALGTATVAACDRLISSGAKSVIISLDLDVGDRIESKILAKFGIATIVLMKTGIIYKYKIEIQTVGAKTVTFFDKSGDCYRLKCIRDGNHSISYNSKEPAITRIGISW